MKDFSILLCCLFILNCNNRVNDNEPEFLTAEKIINKAIKVSGGEKFQNSIIAFDFRDKHYVAKRNSGQFQFERIFKDSIYTIRDILNNSGFQRLKDENSFEISDEKKQAYTASVNSVHYFSVLPFGLNDTSVNKKIIGEEQIKKTVYYKIEVTFNENGGGEDFEDVFVYWINKQTFKPDYLAYSYNEDDGKGIRFREAYNERYINGLRLVDYINYKPEDKSVKLSDLGKAFKNNNLSVVSKIELKNVDVQLIDF